MALDLATSLGWPLQSSMKNMYLNKDGLMWSGGSKLYDMKKKKISSSSVVIGDYSEWLQMLLAVCDEWWCIPVSAAPQGNTRLGQNERGAGPSLSLSDVGAGEKQVLGLFIFNWLYP